MVSELLSSLYWPSLVISFLLCSFTTLAYIAYCSVYPSDPKSSKKPLPLNITIEPLKAGDISNFITSADRGQFSPNYSMLPRRNLGLPLLRAAQRYNPINFPPKLVLCTDLDHTLFGIEAGETHSEVESYIQHFNNLWLTEYAPNNCILVYATGRSIEKVEMAAKEWRSLMRPDVLISKDGVSVYWFNKQLAQLVQSQSTHHIDTSFDDSATAKEFIWYDRSWESSLYHGWDQTFAEQIFEEWAEKNVDCFAPLPKGSKNCEKFRVSPLVKTREDAQRAIQYFEQRCKEYNSEHSAKKLDKKMDIHTFHCIERSNNAWWASMTPSRAGKGCAVDWLRQRLHCENGDNFIVCGDSGNDISMLSLPQYHAVVVKNASKELIDFYEAHLELKGKYMYLTKQDRTRGVIEGLKYFSDRIM